MHHSKLVLVFVSVLNLNNVFGQYNGVATTTKTYDLEVPGSDPIRIIEAEPLWDRNPEDAIVTTTEKSWSDFEHRALRPLVKPTTVPIKTNVNNPRAHSEENETEDSMQDSAEALKKFLKGYAEHLRRTTKSPIEDNIEYDSSEKFHEVELITKPSDEPTNRLANLYLGDKEQGGLSMEDKSKNWNLLDLRRYKPPYEDKNGWVSLEVVPWSVSKVSKWHSNKLKPNSDDKSSINRYSDYNANPVVSKPIWNQLNKPLVSYRPGSTNYYTKPFNYGNSHMQKPDPRPAFPLPSASYAQKVHLHQDYADEVPRPPWNTDSHKHYDNQFDTSNDPDCDHGYQGIITDGLPPNFPKPHQEHNRRKGSFNEEEHPSSHPFNGDGEWVLLTTTKGYKAPNNPVGRQRSLDIESESDLDKESISIHKSVRLTVLPPLKDSKVNMTTSHGGLLQVESTFETVDEAQKTSLKKQNMKRRPLKRRPLKRPLKQTSLVEALPTSNTNSNTTPSVNARKKSPNASSVLAAVGAGMIPATMAMLVPMMGKRRKRDLSYSAKRPRILKMKFNLPRSF